MAPTWFLRMRIDTRPRGFLVGAGATVTRSLGAVQHLARRDGVVGEQSLGIQVSMESNSPLRKVCPQCDASYYTAGMVQPKICDHYSGLIVYLATYTALHSSYHIGEPIIIPKLLLPCVYDSMIMQFYY